MITIWRRLGCLLLLVGQAVCSTVIYMDSGEEFEGEITRVRPKEITIRIAGKESKTLPLARVMGLRIDGAMRNGPFDRADMERLYPSAVDSVIPAAIGDSAPDQDTGLASADSATRSIPPIRKDPYGYRLGIQAKPFNFLIAKSESNHAPAPARFAVARIRIASILGFEIEPSVVLGDLGGFGIVAGPALLQTYDRINANPVTVSMKFHYIHFENWGNEKELFFEITRQIKYSHFLVGIGGEAGVGVTGVTASEAGFSSRGKTTILEVNSGAFLGLVFDIGFWL